MLGSVKRPAIRQILQIGDEFDVPLVVALGKPAETIVIEDAVAGEPTTYYRNPDGSHHVPKRLLEDIEAWLAEEPNHHQVLVVREQLFGDG